LDQLEEPDRNKLFSLPLTLTVARHRLGLIDERIQKKIVDARMRLEKRLGPDNPSVKFFDNGHYNESLSVQDNILFGKVAYGQAEAGDRVSELMSQTLAELNFTDDVQRLGMRHHAGSSGGRLTAVQRQKIAIARALLKKPDLIILDQATAVLDPTAESQMLEKIRDYRKDEGVVWVLDRAELAAGFDHLLVFDRGRMVAEGTRDEVIASRDPAVSALFTA